MRITIIGMPASGKSSLAKAISEKLSIPHIHLDRFWFEAGGADISKKSSIEEKERVRAQVRQKALFAISEVSWVSDGFYSRVQPEIALRADIVIFLDVPLWRRLLNHGRRMFQRPARHSELNLWHELAFFAEIIRRDFTKKPALMKFIQENKHKVVLLKTRQEIQRYLQDLSMPEYPASQ